MRDLIPRRRYSRGPRPGVTGAGPMGQEMDDEEQWIFPAHEPGPEQLRLLLAACIGVAVETVFKLHVYRFGGSLWEQVTGGPIGLRLTAVVAKIRMIRWMRDLKNILRDNGVDPMLAGFYVDDVRTVTPVIPPGVRWCEKSHDLQFSMAWLEEDLATGLKPSPTQGRKLCQTRQQPRVQDLNTHTQRTS